jgi:hypothetical protein
MTFCRLAGFVDQRHDKSMTGQRPFRSIARLVLAGFLAAGLIGGIAASPDATASAASRWTGGVDLYRSGVFTTQQTWLWCTAADIQIIRNIVRHENDHTRSSQQRYFDYMRVHDRYSIPVSDGVDPAGWTAGLRHYVDGRYRLYANGSFDSALRAAVTNLRKTNLPVGITVQHGNHAWILTGFTATADPATTSHFTVTSVRVVGPLWGLQSTSYGYDMRPDRMLTVSQFRGFFTPWHYARIRMAWEGDWVSIQPVAKLTSAAPKVSTTPKPVNVAPATPGPRPAATVKPSSTPLPSPAATDTAEPSAIAIGDLVAPVSAAPAPAEPANSSSIPFADSSAVSLAGGVIVLLVVALAVLGGVGLRTRARR